MGYRVVNEVNNFDYRDSYTTQAEINGKSIVLHVEALIVKSNNSANSNYTNSYAAESRIEFTNATITKLVKLGYRRFDANDNLIEEIKDKEEPFAAIDMEKLMSKVFVTGIEKAENSDSIYHLMIELPDEEPGAITDEYDIEIVCDEIITSWDSYMNRVADM